MHITKLNFIPVIALINMIEIEVLRLVSKLRETFSMIPWVNSRKIDRQVCYTSFQFVFPVTEAQIFALSLYNNRTVLVSFF